MNTISNLIIPLLVLVVILYALKKKVAIYDVFIDGAKESFDMILKLFPCLLAMIVGVNLFLKSGVVVSIFKFITFIPTEILPMIFMRPISGTSSLAILTNIFEAFGPDGFLGTLASFIQGSTDTTFYVITLYFGSIGIKKIRYALWAGLFADLVAIVASIIMVNIIM